MVNKKFLLGAALAAVAAGGSVLAITAGADTLTSGKDATFSALQTAVSAKPSDLAWASAVPAPPELKLNVAAARTVFASGAQTAWLIPASPSPCLAIHNAGGNRLSCPTGPEREAANITFGSAFGVVPDSVTTVTYVLADGSTQTGTVTNNVWHAPAEAQTVSYQESGRTVTDELQPLSSLPADAHVDPSGLTVHGDAPSADVSALVH